MDNTNSNHSLFPENLIPVLVHAWQSAGHSFGVDNHLQLRQVLQSFDSGRDLSELKYLLAPIFADSPPKQDEFYELFDLVLEDTQIALEEHEDRVAQLHVRTPGQQLEVFKRTAIQRWQHFTRLQRIMLLTGAIALLTSLVSWGVYVRYFKGPKIQLTAQVPQLFVAIEAGTSGYFCLYNDAPGFERPISISLASRPASIVSVVPQASGNNICFQAHGRKLGRESVDYKICYNSGNCHRFQFIFLVDNIKRPKIDPRLINNGELALKHVPLTVDDVPEEEDSKESILPDALSNEQKAMLDTMIMSRDPSKAVEGVTSNLRFGKGFSYFSWTKAGFLGVAGAILWFIGWYIRRKRQKFTMEHQPNREHPYVWNLRIPSLSRVDLGEAFNKNLRNMLRRDKTTSQQLDVKNTIKASLKRGGAIDFQYLQFKQSRQYLVLLDISSQNNHRAKILNLFIKSLQEAGAPVEYYFFDGDPRLCWNEKRSKGISLRQMVHLYQDYHLIFCSDSHRLLQPTTGQLAKWTDSFGVWRKKLILTPRGYSNWDLRENLLSKNFRLLPCTPNGIAFLVESLESVDPMDYKKLGYIESDEELYDILQIPAQLSGAELISYLEAEFVTYQHGKANDVLLKWIASCAIPPVMFWHWTLYVGQMLNTSVINYLSMENLFQIIRLPWFVEGNMPEDVRLTLINWLEENHPEWLTNLRKEWDAILNLEDNLPPQGSMAWEGHRLEIILNELLQDPAWTKRRKLELELEQLMHGKEERDAMVIKYLNKKQGGLEAVLSNRFRRFVQEKEGLFWHFRMWVWQLPVLSLLFVLSLLVHYTEPVTSFQFGQRVTALQFTEDSKSFMVASGNGALALCTVEGEWIQGLDESKNPIIGLSSSQDGNKILAGSSNNAVSGWDITGVPLFFQKGQKRLVRDIAFHPLDPNIVLIACFDKKAELWDIQQQKVLAEFNHTDIVNSVAFSPTGELILTGSSDGTAKLWNANGPLLETMNGHEGKVHCVAFSSDGQYLATGSRDNTAKVWNLNGEVIHTLEGHRYDVFDVAFSPDGSQLVTAAGDDRAIIWSIENGRKIRTFGGHRNYITNATFSPNGRYLLTGDREGKVKLWTLNSGKDN